MLDETGLTLAAQKIKIVLISGRKIVEKMEVTIGGTRIETKHNYRRQIELKGAREIDRWEGICRELLRGRR